MRKRLSSILVCSALAGCGSGDSTLGSVSQTAASTPPTNLTARQEVVIPRVLESQFQTEFVVKNQWSGGYVGEIVLTYQGSQTLSSGWVLSFDLPAHLESVWNARRLSQTGTRYRLGNESYNSTLAPGQKVSIGFVASFSGALVQPTSYQLEDLSPEAITPPSTPPSNLTATFAKDNDWGSGFVGAIVIKNTGTQPVSEWALTFRLNGTLDSLWNGVLQSQQGGLVRVAPASYNRNLAPGQEIRVGFQGRPGSPQVTEISLTGASVPTPAPTPPAPTTGGYLHTQGSAILDWQNRPKILRGVNWFGMETNTFCPHGLWTRSLDSMLDQISAQGYNCLRLPYSNELLKASAQPNGINWGLNADLQGLSGLQIMDKVIQKAGTRGLLVILDRHRPDSSGQSALWYDARCSEAQWLSDWELLANRYKDNPTVVACDLHNEPHDPATWGDNNASTDWRLAAERAGNRILAINPNLLIMVEGVSRAGGSDYWWGGNLKPARQAPVRLTVADRLVYSSHDYPATVFPQSWFSAANYPANLSFLWDIHWGYLAKENIAPVLLGEFGTRYETASDRLWLDALVVYLKANGISSTFWSWNPNSGDTGGLLQDDWQTVHPEKRQALDPLLQP
ncbi:cellulase family glycosylhydrolase [bacterium]|nr:cellulase family glycosylhydrolase [bacterium]